LPGTYETVHIDKAIGLDVKVIQWWTIKILWTL